MARALCQVTEVATITLTFSSLCLQWSFSFSSSQTLNSLAQSAQRSVQLDSEATGKHFLASQSLAHYFLLRGQSSISHTRYCVS